MWTERNSTLRGMSAVGLAFLLNSCGGDTQIIQVVQPMGGTGGVPGTGGAGNIGKPTMVGTGGNSLTPVSGGAPTSNFGGTGAAASGGAAVSVGTGGSAEVGGTGSMGGAGAEIGGATTGGAVNTGGTGGGVPTMTEAECKLGMPGTDASCLDDSGYGRWFVWGGRCYWFIPGDIFSPDGMQDVCRAGGGSLVTLNCAEESAELRQRWGVFKFETFGNYSWLLLGGVVNTDPTKPFKDQTIRWRSDETATYATTAGALSYLPQHGRQCLGLLPNLTFTWAPCSDADGYNAVRASEGVCERAIK